MKVVKVCFKGVWPEEIYHAVDVDRDRDILILTLKDNSTLYINLKETRWVHVLEKEVDSNGQA